ncbi:MAG TPA: hypothetical protein VKB76_06085 [Ktedonobacterales bacterium]|nr:hypothetical protein [Ktedonobacterales bacterium]
MRIATQDQEIVQQKLAAFERLQPEFESSFRHIQAMHGQQRFATISTADIVRYPHGLWICERKDRLLGISRTIPRYEGRLCLELLAQWQRGEMAEVIAFLQRKLDTLPVADLTRQIQLAQQAGRMELAQRLAHGRNIVINRGLNLLHALDTICSQPAGTILSEVRAACAQLGHSPEHIQQQIVELDTPLYAYLPRRALAQRNMVVMNALGVSVTAGAADQPGNRSDRVQSPAGLAGSYAEIVIGDYHELTSPNHNNPRGDRFIDQLEPTIAGVPFSLANQASVADQGTGETTRS